MMKLAVIGAIAISTVSAEVITFEDVEYSVPAMPNSQKTCYDHDNDVDRCFIFSPMQRQARLPALQAPTIVSATCQSYTQVVTTGGRRLLQDEGATRCYTLGTNGQKNYVSCATGTIQTETVVKNTCTDEELITENAMINSSVRDYESWEEAEHARALSVALHNASGHCMCDSFCLSMGDCCADFHWWCSPSKGTVSMDHSHTGMDFPWPAISPEVEVEEPVSTTRCYTIGTDGVTKNYVACSGSVTTTTPTTTTPTTSSTNCYTLGTDGVTKNYVACSGNVSTNVSGTSSQSRCYTLGTDGITKNYVPCSN